MKKGGMQLRNSPDIPVLHQLLSKAVQRPGEKQHCNWRHSDGLPLFLEVINPLKERYVQWQLFCDKSGKRTMLFECVGHDILMVFNQISAAINNLPTSVGRPEESSRVLRARQARAMQAANAEVTVSVTEPDMPKPKVTGTDSDMARLRASTVEHEIAKPKSRATDADVAKPVAKQEPKQEPKQEQKPEPKAEPKPAPKPAAKPEPKPESKPAAALSAQAEAVAKKAQDLETTLVNFDDQNDDRFKTVETVRPVLPKPILSIPDQSAQSAQKATTESLKPQNKPFDTAPVKAESAKEAFYEEPQVAQYPLHGDLKEIATLQLLQLLKSEQVTGRLRIDAGDDCAVLYLRDGTVVQALLGESSGDEALLQVLQWTDGQFALTAGMRTSGVNVDSTPEELLSHQNKINVLLERLSDAGMTADSTFVRTKNGVTRDDFYRLATPNAPVEVDALAELYMTFDGRTTLTDLGDLTELRDLALLQALYHLVSLDLVGFRDITPVDASFTAKPAPTIHESSLEAIFEPQVPVVPQPITPKVETPKVETPRLGMPGGQLPGQSGSSIIRLAGGRPLVEPKVIDGAMIQSVMMSLRRQDTGLFIFPAFLYFLEEEFFRVYRAKGNLSILIFELCELVSTPTGIIKQALPAATIADASLRIARRKRHTDIVAHYETHNFAVLLPGTGSGGTRVFANKMIKSMGESPLQGAAGKRLSLAVGSASIPEDFTNLNSLLGAAEVAMRYSLETGRLYTAFKDV